jgi:hypothetical protein
MKIRSGFVSNSSSSSFVILGFKTNEGIDIPKGHSYVNMDDDSYIIGYIIADDEYLEDDEIDFSILEAKRQKISEDFGKDLSEIKLYTGTRQC